MFDMWLFFSMTISAAVSISIVLGLFSFGFPSDRHDARTFLCMVGSVFLSPLWPLAIVVALGWFLRKMVGQFKLAFGKD